MVNCVRCGVELTEKNQSQYYRKVGIKRCSKCEWKRQKEAHSKNPEHYAALNRAKVARWRLRHPEHDKEYYKNHKDEYSDRARKLLWKYKTDAFQQFGGKCRNCGNSDFRVLQINHKNGGGSKEGKFGIRMYMAIVKGTRNIKDIELLCANCNNVYEYERGIRKTP
jgi:hypothetical protein